jgi:peptidoglycan/xylan/chitin deacetylase (PgdA/CDA1 family)
VPNSLVVLGWHNVAATWCFPNPSGRGRAGLARQLQLVRRTAHVVDLADAVAALSDGGRLPPRAVALTFDDGYRDNLTQAVPILRHLGLRATFFLVPDVLSRTTTPWWEVLGAAFARTSRRSLWWDGQTRSLDGPARRQSYEIVCESLKQVDERTRQQRVRSLTAELHPNAKRAVESMFLDWDDARALTRNGMRVGSHTCDHVILSNEEPCEQRRNLRESRVALESGLDTDVELLAYPNGSAADFDDVTEQAARDAGYRAALTTIPGPNSSATPPYRVRRFVVGPERGVVGLRSLVTYRWHRHDTRVGR